MLIGTVKIVKTDSDVVTPSYHSESAAGLDLAANQDCDIHPGAIQIIRTGIKMEIPEGYEGTIRGRSGLAFEHRIFVTHMGTIDADYRGELYIMLTNLGNTVYSVKKGDRIGQIVISPILKANVREVDKLSRSKRGTKGFGSTGSR